MKKTIIKSMLFVLALSCITKATAQPQTQGILTFSFTPTAHSPAKHALVVYITNLPGGGGFVKTLNRYCDATTSNYLNTWAAVANCGYTGSPLTLDATTSSCITVGAVLGGSLNTYSTVNTSWDGNIYTGFLEYDQTNYVAIEEAWGTGATNHVVRYFSFEKGPAIDDQTTGIANDANFTGISLLWTPNAMATAQFTENPTLKVYPNPSRNGIFNIDFSNQVNNIKVIDMLGKVVYNEIIKADTTDTTKKIDLSSITNGVYFINATNDKGTSNYKVILDK